ncbi:MAG: transcription-repair coupling factor [Candidatus Nanopelagicales bacterium]|nr:transcription-repair coupling factor [Candidatus Nanopelagicales bacterium]
MASQADSFRAAREQAFSGGIITSPQSVQPLITALLAAPAPIGSGRRLMVVTATGQEAEDLASELQAFCPELRLAVLPSWETLPHERLSPSSDTIGRRVAVLRRLAHPDASDPLLQPIDVLVASVRAVVQPIAGGLGEVEPVRLREGEQYDLSELVERLVHLGYERMDLVERRGQLAVRGGILDVFPPNAEHPLRLEFWGDSVEEIRAFAVTDQRSLEIAPDGLFAPPVRELLLTDDVRARAATLARDNPTLADICSQIAEGIAVEGMEALIPVLVDTVEPLVSFLPESTSVVLLDPERVRTRAHDLVRTADEFLAASWHNAAVGNRAPIDLSGSNFLTLDEVKDLARARDLPWCELTPLLVDDSLDADAGVNVQAAGIDAYRGDVTAAFGHMRQWAAERQAVVLVSEGHGSAQRLAESLASEGIACAFVEGIVDAPPVGQVTVTVGSIDHGFMLLECALIVITERDLVGQRASTKDMRRLPSRRRRAIDPLTLTPGDFVVHEQHGVGRYVEMVQREVGGATREYLVVEYASSKRGQPADRLYVPTDQLDQVTKYVGGEMPSVHRLGGADWQKAKGKARKAVKEIAGELIRLYAARQATKGHAYGPDTPWQRELEDAFAYIETPDQLMCIDEVKRDMESTVPMDRLICGDVGYGKTEIAVRAAFKAVQDGKQVAVLVPTTLLVQQHVSTFTERFGSFPIRVGALSRFNSDKEAKAVLAGVGDGTVDIVIGTHRLLTPDVRFKDLGLVILDEEQRFGVEHKEHLKALRTNVDVLAMSATPIPRTLEMAVTGIREMSVIQTPPEERHPVLTFVGPYDDRQISAAIRRELLRDGQVFFVHNRVESIERVATRLRDLIPEARIAIAHGQMGEQQLESVIIDFWEKAVDVLVCTTIVESGIDIANANTLIVDRADMFGLSQLHQLRGRVGRGRERAYAYFLYNPEKPMTETAHERLATIAQHTDLGSGMQIALKDLEIRGAGNLLGGEQSGHIADVGFDLYVRLVGEALAEHKGDTVEDHAEMRVELPIEAHIPHAYIAHERLRLEAYKRLADVGSDQAVDEVFAELTDRYGPLPAPVETLLAVARLRVLARRAGLADIVAQGAGIRFHPVTLPESSQMRLTRLYPGTQIKGAVNTIIVPKPMTSLVGGQPVRGNDLLDWVTTFIRATLPLTPEPTETS